MSKRAVVGGKVEQVYSVNLSGYLQPFLQILFEGEKDTVSETEFQTSLKERILGIRLNLIWTSKLLNLR